ncbi:uncharacterized protein [Aristolochia californica]|uniref:uncharacterized protein n=1 Tax=Aristolochia californica TaxID=171875 RepID=UPI0035DF8F46
MHNSNTMKVRSRLQHLQLLALVDLGSTHNFVSQLAAQQLGLMVQNNTGISVSVANGETISSAGISHSTAFHIEEHSFVLDFLVIPLAGFDLVLGIKWLQTLGPVLWDFKALTMTFMAQQHPITLHGTHAPTHCTLQKIKVLDADHCKLNSLVTEFGDLFQTPTALPPLRNFDPRIPMKLGTEPVVVLPYHYPHLQKDEIDR